MGSNASKFTSAYSVCNYSTILRSGTAFKIGDLDVSERQLLLELRRIILIDEVLDLLLIGLYQSLSRFLGLLMIGCLLRICGVLFGGK